MTPIILIESTPTSIGNVCYITPGSPVTFRIVSGITSNVYYQWYLNDVLVSVGSGYTLSNPSLNDKVYMKQVPVDLGVTYRVVNNTDGANANNVGTIRYRKSGTNSSLCEMVMQTGTSTYQWVVIKINTW